jgi:uncharacterized protein (DUF1800 family)
MLTYLDQAQSVGPNSPAGRRGGRGLNENLAREILELHTLGVDGGYVQRDVEGFARVLTGWSLSRETLKYQFNATMHEPGAHTVLGKSYSESGEQQGLSVLRDLARHPSTAKFLATKLARHFIADDPPEAAVQALTATFLRTNGDLKELTRVLIRRPEVWSQTMPKVKPPFDWLASLMRATRLDFLGRGVSDILTDLGQPPFNAPSPAGWPDRASAWLAPEALLKRIELAGEAARRMNRATDPNELARQVIGPVAHADTTFWISRAPTATDGITLLLASAEFQRR